MDVYRDLDGYIITKENSKPFAKGAYGSIYKCEKDNQVFVAKIIQNVPKFKDIIEAEKKMVKQLKRVKCKYILFYEKLIEKKDITCFITKYCNKGTLETLINEEKFLKIPFIRSIFNQMAIGLKELHSIPIIHRDIKPANIFLHEDKGIIAVLADFGFSTNKEVASTILGTPITMSPELMNNQLTDSKIDIWAIGIVLYNACFGTFPFEKALAKSITKGGYMIPQYFVVAKECIELIELCLQDEPKDRISASEMTDHPFLKVIKIINLYRAIKA